MEIRDEEVIFSELANLCKSSGYIHAIAYLCFRDNTIKYADTVKAEDILQQFSMERLVRTEISTLIGLACKTELITDIPSPHKLQEYIDKTDALLKEIHHSMMASPDEIFNPDKIGEEGFNPFKSGNVLRESIFYGGEAAYNFQYRDLSRLKYRKDNDWFIANKGFSVDQAIDVINAIQSFQNEKINETIKDMASRAPDEWSFLSAYTFKSEEISKLSGQKNEIVRSVIESFASSADMDCFTALDDFNPKNAYPIITIHENEYLLLQNYSLVEALYETPFFWFNADKSYKTKAMDHRGEFTEEFSLERLKTVFGKDRVFSNIDIYDAGKTRVGEIDVLVVFANRAIVLQAKSKKLTISARKGNDNSLQDDFKKAVQDSYNQAYSCSIFLNDESYSLITSDGTELDIKRSYREIYPFCVVSDHYPALTFQARQFLEFTETDAIKAPFVMDVFLLDVMTEMLQSPLHFLSYVNRRTEYGDKILSTHELTILSYHLKQNLWMDGEYTMMQLADDICADLDLAMLSRREGIPGDKVPEGILTKYNGTAFHNILCNIDKIESSATLDLGFMLLTLSGDTVEMINDGISQLVRIGKSDGKHHDLTLGISEGSSGITLHCNDDPIKIAAPRLESHCRRRKYSFNAETWFGICINHDASQLKFGVTLDYTWKQSDEMDEIVKDLPKGQKLEGKKKINFKTVAMKSKKVGRNDLCICGSGMKYKKCCL